MGNKTALFEAHQQAGGKMVDFGGWDMPIHYGSQLEEHHSVRRDVGMFDVSHMTVVDVVGDDAKAYLQYLLANDVDKLKVDGKALYSGMLAEDGGVIDDLIVYRVGAGYRVVVNCATREKDLAWMSKQAQAYSVAVIEQPQLGIVAIQGPNAVAKVSEVLGADAAAVIAELKIFVGAAFGDWWLARTGYTGEDGLEIILPNEEVPAFWKKLVEAGVAPCGLGARDTLRLEAGMNLYGLDMDESISPLAANMSWTIAFEPAERNFIGRKALEEQKAAGNQDKLVGLVFDGKGILRAHQKVIIEGVGVGEITSGSFSPTLGYSVALARVPAGTGENVLVEIRKKQLPVKVVKAPFVRNGEKVY